MRDLQYQSTLSSLTCLNATNLLIKGKFTSGDFRYIRLDILPCNSNLTTGCKTPVAIKAYFQNQIVSLVYSDYYFDLSDALPANMFIQDNYMERLQSDKTVITNVFLQNSELNNNFAFANYSRSLFQTGSITTGY
jgi:hypothetical protein